MYNAARYLEQTLASVYQQTMPRWELILCDDGSTDETLAIARAAAETKRDQRIHIVAQQNKGVAAARNAGVAATDPNAPFVAFLDHDDLWEPNTLELLSWCLEATAGAVGAHGLVHRMRASGLRSECESLDFDKEADIMNLVRRKIAHNENGMWEVTPCAALEPTTFAALAYDGCFWTPGALLLRRSAFSGLQFRQKFAPCDDHDLWLRLSLLGPIAFLPQVVVHWREHSGNASRKTAAIVRAMAAIRYELIQRNDLEAEQHEIALFRYNQLYMERITKLVDWSNDYTKSEAGSRSNFANWIFRAHASRVRRHFRKIKDSPDFNGGNYGPLPPAIDEAGFHPATAMHMRMWGDRYISDGN